MHTPEATLTCAKLGAYKVNFTYVFAIHYNRLYIYTHRMNWNSLITTIHLRL